MNDGGSYDADNDAAEINGRVGICIYQLVNGSYGVIKDVLGCSNNRTWDRSHVSLASSIVRS